MQFAILKQTKKKHFVEEKERKEDQNKVCRFVNGVIC